MDIKPYNLTLEQFKQIVDVMYDELLIYDSNYDIVYINDACSRHYQCEPQQMIGKSFFDFVNDDWWDRSILPVVFKEKRAVATRQSTYIGSSLLTIAVPIFNEAGDVTHVVMNVRDDIEELDLYTHQNYEMNLLKTSSENKIIANNDTVKELLNVIYRMKDFDTTCVITGESGTGKTLLAKYMHEISERKDEPFININCASIPNELIESELFGYEEGAFTGASPKGKTGLILAADKGTLLLDEIGELSLKAQAKLLTVLQDKEFIPIGKTESIKVDIRVIATTNKDLKSLVENGKFREDLYYRINVIEFYVPPLRRRKEDIFELTESFLKEFNKKYKVNRSISAKALQMFLEYDWPGNIRELRHLVERLVVTVDSLIIDTNHLPFNIFNMINDDKRALEEKLSHESFDRMVEEYEALIVNNAYKKHSSSRKLAEFLNVSQTRANKLINKYIK